jgi:hypothetical protein
LLVRKTYGNGWDIPGGYVDRGKESVEPRSLDPAIDQWSRPPDKGGGHKGTLPICSSPVLLRWGRLTLAGYAGLILASVMRVKYPTATD